MSRILVTGGLGFIGGSLVEELISRGDHVTVLDNRSSNSLAGAEDFSDPPLLKILTGDVRVREDVKSALEGVSVVVHLAAAVDVQKSVEDPKTTKEVNVEGTSVLLAASAKAGVRRFILASSAAVYGARAPPLSEDVSPDPLSPYASSKVAAEALCDSYAATGQLETVSLRIFNAYGPRAARGSGVVALFLRAMATGEPLTISGDGEQTRDFVHVNDVVKAVILSKDAALKGERAFNVATSVPTTINRLAEIIRAAAARELRVVHGPARLHEVRHSCADISRARRVLGFEPSVPLERGIGDILGGSESRDGGKRMAEG